ncbi:MAG: bifunctional phosphoribosylaminoimidazolecarboxamide formyltransferase/inosine monophosphate cyclohydrolase [Bacteroidetes bacterium CG23_combo_of_CG06-09_8_20_14_all_32_9]|nr:MAG: bifunctional phosphoribosylaminoimidazolecarboxamide formyltransferase/inosine monophosphate cyclohydrolase [Bacteroidetes bacterium CG23_combo_of_CG06-09_8_20_14_all_32_9]
MNNLKSIMFAFISVYNKDGLEVIVKKLHQLNIQIISTGGTHEFIKKMNIPVISAESLTGFPSILGGRVKTLHPNIFGGILARRNDLFDMQQVDEYKFTLFDLVIIDLYPFEETVEKGASDEDIIEKIDIGGISLIRAAAKNFNDVVIISCKDQYSFLYKLLDKNAGSTTLEERRKLATEAFEVTSHYDTFIYKYFAGNSPASFKASVKKAQPLRYGENPHQKGVFYGNLNDIFEKLHGKEISYNNLLDIDAAIALISEFKETTVAIIKHNNACGLASRNTLLQAWKDALAGDPVSAFGGIIVTNRNIDKETSLEINKLFFEVIIAPGYNDDALEILKQKKNRIILILKNIIFSKYSFRTLLNGVIEQDKDLKTETIANLHTVTKRTPTQQEIEDLIFANIIVKHTKSNAIVLTKNKQLLASGTGQTSRIDALKHAIEKAKSFGFNLQGSVMSSDAFFPFADSVELAYNAGITAVIQPGGSIRDEDSIRFCSEHKMAMVFTGIRHFKH